MRESLTFRSALVHYAFDLLHLDGYDARAAPLIQCKRVLQSLPSETQFIRRATVVAWLTCDLLHCCDARGGRIVCLR